ncbi:hypothetical protein [Streptomyces sp. NPDC058718]|uniref:hypothetical protein n=1 Tax=Streptomyces sp. NPDC058718 TaxID=3346610 RepID=UPI003680448B
MERAGGERRAPITVENGAGVVVIGDGNRIGSPEPAAVRSGYREQVRRIAPAELVDREDELAELAAFCRADSGPAYTWWRAEAWAGKTALLSWFALHPPPGVRIVPFFITARLGAQNDVVAYVDVVLEQLAELAGEGLPALLTAATREAHLLRLYASAAETCAARGERLVLLVDGLDEDRGVTTGPDAHSIASLLPYGLRVIVSGRLNPPLPVDVPDDHPLRDPGAVRILSPSPKARAIRAEAERELKRLLEAGGLPYELLALLTAAGGGLTADDLAELTGEIPYRVKDVLRTGPGRTFALRGDAYLLAHEELAAGAREMLGERELDRRRGAVTAWAEEWRRRGWPADTPAHLLHGWFPALRAAGDLKGMLGCGLDAARHDRLLEATGGDGAAAAEIRAAGDGVLARVDWPDRLLTMLRLAMRRDVLGLRSGSVPPELAGAWVMAGEVDRAVALAGGESPLRTVRVLAEVATRLLRAGDRDRATELVDRVEGLIGRTESTFERVRAAECVVPLLLTSGAYERAERMVRAMDVDFRDGTVPVLVEGLCRAGEWTAALRVARDVAGEGTGGEMLVASMTVTVCRSLLAAGRVDEALKAVTEGPGHSGLRAALLLHGALVLRNAGHEERGASLREEALRAVDALHPEGLDARVVAGALAEAGEYERLRSLGLRVHGVPGDELFADQLARAHAWGPALAVLDRLPPEPRGRIVRQVLAEELTAAGRTAEAESLVATLPVETAEPYWEALALARVENGDPEGALALLDRLGGSGRDRVLGAYARRLMREGRSDQALAMTRTGGPQDAPVSVAVADELLTRGDSGTAVALLTTAERFYREPAREELVRRIAAVAEGLAQVPGLRETARGFLTEAVLRGGLGDPSRLVDALVAVGETDRAEAVAFTRSGLVRAHALIGVVRRRAADGAYGTVARLAEGSDELFNVAYLVGLRALAEAGAAEAALSLALTARRRGLETEAHALVAEALARAGRTREAME